MEVRVFNTIDGSPVGGSNVLPFTDESHTLGWNEDGAIGVSIRWHRLMDVWRARWKLRPWKHTLAVIDDGEVLIAGPITSRRWEGLTLKIDAGDGWALWKKRLVLNHALATAWVDGEVLIDEDNPAPQWVLTIAGQSYAGIGAALVRESLKWGPLLVDTPDPDPGTHVKTYNGWDLATVHERLRDLGALEGGPLIRWPAYLRPDGHLRIRYETGDAQTVHEWVTAAPGQGVSIVSVDEDGASMATEAFALGGRNADLVLVARSKSTTLTAAGWPVLQVADKSRSSVSELPTLKGYTGQAVIDGSMLPESYELKVPSAIRVAPGDWVNLSIQDPYLGQRDVPLSVVEVRRGTSHWQSVSAFPRENDAETDQ